jgi:uncharacterized LabA/DUF88 family protein/cold shock CspA family protein
MLKAGVFLDSENLVRNGGKNLRYDVVRKLVEAQNATILRANAYMAIDSQRESVDMDFRMRNENYRNATRRHGFHLVLKETQRYLNNDGVEVMKANADIDLTVDALLQAENLDYILLGTGDGDFLRLIRALQNKGKRVDLLSFANVSADLRREADYHFYGFLIPELVRNNHELKVGIIHHIDEQKGYGFMTLRHGYHVADIRTDVFLHINELQDQGRPIGMEQFLQYKRKETLIEFEAQVDEQGRTRAVNAHAFEFS